MKTVDANDPRTPSAQIADDLRERIDKGEFAEDARLPSIRELAGQYGVAQMTAQGALQRLRDERRAWSNGRGYFVGEGPAADSPNLAERVQDLEAEVRELRSRIATLESSE